MRFTSEQEAQLTQLASAVGITAEDLVKEWALNLLAKQEVNPLPVWHLGGVIGSLHRRDTYDDAD